jgi:endo-1,4-beta-xylanase
MDFKNLTHKSNLKLSLISIVLLASNLLACKSSLEEDLSPKGTETETVVNASDLGEVAEIGSYKLKGYTLKDVFDFPIGAAVVKERLTQDLYSSTLKREFSRLSSESDFKTHVLQPQEGVFNFTKADAVVAYAQQNNMKVHGHTLIWALDGMTPKWIVNHAGGRDVFLKILKDHIYTVVRHFKGKVQSWDVVNEAIVQGGFYKDNVWLRKIGQDYILKACQYAVEADPNLKYFLNDFSLEYGGKKLKLYMKIIDEARAKNIRIDGLGYQMHAVIRMDMNLVHASFAMAAKKGLLIHLSEFDVALRYQMPSSFPLTDLMARAQGAKVKEIVYSYLNNVPKKQQFGITTWGVSDKDSYFNRNSPNLDHDYPLLFDKYYKAKWAYRGFIEAGLGR